MKVHEKHKHQAPEKIRLALVVVSTSRYEEKKLGNFTSDKTIPIVEEIISRNYNILLNSIEIVPDLKDKIKLILNEFTSLSSIDGIIFSGGTGLSHKDITYETIEPLMSKKISGFGEIFRQLSFEEIGSSAMLSRATAGIIKKKIVFLLPGSPNAVKLALEKLIIPEIGHIVYLMNKEE